ncbi:MAG TPA: ABC transporter permease, partial [Pyrinomonadaceae bacterium]|nr:ABC transporter permease [Pyrinomonadaceae bacterium]
MSRLAQFWRRILYYWQSSRFDRELEEEVRFHLEMKAEENLSHGMTPEEARYAAQRQFGNRTLLQEVSREMWRFSSLETLLQDLRYGVRVLWKSPAFTLVAIVALALGIGANSAIFSIVDTVLLRPLPYKDPDRLVMVWEERSKLGFPRDTPAPANFIDWRDQNQVFEGMAAFTSLSFNLTGAGDPERIDGQRVTAGFFPLLGVEPLVGRPFLTEEDQPGRNQVVVMSHSLWARRFNSDTNIIGKPLTLNGESFIVVGVMPPSFKFPSPNDELWIPIAFDSSEASRRGSHYLQVIARLKPQINLKQAQSEMDTIAARLQAQYPQTNTSVGVALTPLHEQLVGDIRSSLLILLGAVGFVLLIACANVANLLLARAAARQKEIALRIALGAGRLRLIRQFLTESVLLAVIGGGLGLLLSVWGINLLEAFIPDSISQARAIPINLRVFVFTLLVSLLTGVIFGLVPALQASKTNLNETLKEGGRDSAAGTHSNRARSLLVIAEVALALVLLIGAGLLIKSFIRLRSVDPGFRTDHLLTMKIVLPELKYPDKEKRAAFYTELLNRIETLPGVQSAAVTTSLPLTFKGNSAGITIEGRPEPAPDQRPIAVTRVISPNYFHAMGIQLLRGRQFGVQDREDSNGVVIINETMARQFWPGEDTIGKRIKLGNYNSDLPWLSVVGIVKDVKQFELTAEPRPQIYLPYSQTGIFQPRDLVVRTAVEPLSLAASVRKAVWEIDKDQPVSNIGTMEHILSESLSRQRFSML